MKRMISGVFFLVLCLNCLTCPPAAAPEQPSPEWAQYYHQHYNFTLDSTFHSFLRVIPTWEETLRPFKG